MTSGKQARNERQAKIAAAAPRESKLKPLLGLIIAIVALAAIGGAIYAGTRGADSGSENASGLPRGAVSDSGGIVLNATEPKQGAPVLDVYEDFQCSWCKTFHEILGPRVNELASSGEVKVVLHYKTFLDQGKEGGDSMRVANAATCASDAGPEPFAIAHDQLMNAQPAQEQQGQGWPAETMSQIADQAGITGEARTTYDTCVSDLKYKDYLERVDEQSARDGVQATPTYTINGEDFDLGQVLTQDGTQRPEAFDEAIAEATKN